MKSPASALTGLSIAVIALLLVVSGTQGPDGENFKHTPGITTDATSHIGIPWLDLLTDPPASDLPSTNDWHLLHLCDEHGFVLYYPVDWHHESRSSVVLLYSGDPLRRPKSPLLIFNIATVDPDDDSTPFVTNGRIAGQPAYIEPSWHLIVEIVVGAKRYSIFDDAMATPSPLERRLIGAVLRTLEFC